MSKITLNIKPFEIIKSKMNDADLEFQSNASSILKFLISLKVKLLSNICDKNLPSGKIGIKKSFTGIGKATLIKVSLDSQLMAKPYLLNSKLRSRFQEHLLLNFLNFISNRKSLMLILLVRAKPLLLKRVWIPTKLSQTS